MDKEITGKIWLKKGNENFPPMVVYVTCWHNMVEAYVCKKLNSGETVFGQVEDLIEFDNDLLDMLYYEWKLERQAKVTNNFRKAYIESKDIYERRATFKKHIGASGVKLEDSEDCMNAVERCQRCVHYYKEGNVEPCTSCVANSNYEGHVC